MFLNFKYFDYDFYLTFIFSVGIHDDIMTKRQKYAFDCLKSW